MKAQAGLRGLMEEATTNGECIFILDANNLCGIDPAIRSRCSVFDFSYDDLGQRNQIMAGFRERIGEILEVERIELDWETIDRILQQHGLDFRAALNELEKYI